MFTQFLTWVLLLCMNCLSEQFYFFYLVPKPVNTGGQNVSVLSTQKCDFLYFTVWKWAPWAAAFLNKHFYSSLHVEKSKWIWILNIFMLNILNGLSSEDSAANNMATVKIHTGGQYWCLQRILNLWNFCSRLLNFPRDVFCRNWSNFSQK